AGRRLVPLRSIVAGGDVHGLRDVAAAGGRIFALDVYGARVVVLDEVAEAGAGVDRETRTRSFAPCRGGLSLDLVRAPGEPLLLANCLLDHALVLWDLAGAERARSVHDGPFWSVAAASAPDGALLVASGGVEDRPLDRSDGFFGWIDSFVYLDRVGPDGVERLAAVDVSDAGLVTPKW